MSHPLKVELVQGDSTGQVFQNEHAVKVEVVGEEQAGTTRNETPLKVYVTNLKEGGSSEIGMLVKSDYASTFPVTDADIIVTRGGASEYYDARVFLAETGYLPGTDSVGMLPNSYTVLTADNYANAYTRIYGNSNGSTNLIPLKKVTSGEHTFNFQVNGTPVSFTANFTKTSYTPVDRLKVFRGDSSGLTFNDHKGDNSIDKYSYTYGNDTLYFYAVEVSYTTSTGFSYFVNEELALMGDCRYGTTAANIQSWLQGAHGPGVLYLVPSSSGSLGSFAWTKGKQYLIISLDRMYNGTVTHPIVDESVLLTKFLESDGMVYRSVATYTEGYNYPTKMEQAINGVLASGKGDSLVLTGADRPAWLTAVFSWKQPIDLTEFSNCKRVYLRVATSYWDEETGEEKQTVEEGYYPVLYSDSQTVPRSDYSVEDWA